MQHKVKGTYSLFLNMKLNAKHTMVNASPAVARSTNITVSGRATVTVSFKGIPSLGMPSAKKKVILKTHHIVSIL